MASEHIGRHVEARTRQNNVYSGTVADVDGSSNSLTLVQVVKNATQAMTSVTLSARDILELKEATSGNDISTDSLASTPASSTQPTPNPAFSRGNVPTATLLAQRRKQLAQPPASLPQPTYATTQPPTYGATTPQASPMPAPGIPMTAANLERMAMQQPPHPPMHQAAPPTYAYMAGPPQYGPGMVQGQPSHQDHVHALAASVQQTYAPPPHFNAGPAQPTSVPPVQSATATKPLSVAELEAQIAASSPGLSGANLRTPTQQQQQQLNGSNGSPRSSRQGSNRSPNKRGAKAKSQQPLDFETVDHQPYQYQDSRRTPARQRKKDAATFSTNLMGTSSNDNIGDDFDFQANLAKFDKNSIFREIAEADDIDASHRLVAHNKRPAEAKIHYTESALDENSQQMQQAGASEIARARQATSFVSDHGYPIPVTTLETRRRLIRYADSLGYKEHTFIENSGRSVSEMALQLLGGARRINPSNRHQLPTVIVLAGDAVKGQVAICAARHLANHNIKVKLCVPASAQIPLGAIDMFSNSDGEISEGAESLPDTLIDPVDLILDGLAGLSSDIDDALEDDVCQMIQWANEAKSSKVAIDLPSGYLGDGSEMEQFFQAKWIVALGLPLDTILNERFAGHQIYLADAGIPRLIFNKVNISFPTSPFADKFVVALHRS
eukprot:Clim_evm59s172 gene=Clim_evmTU59s172